MFALWLIFLRRSLGNPQVIAKINDMFDMFAKQPDVPAETRQVCVVACRVKDCSKSAARAAQPWRDLRTEILLAPRPLFDAQESENQLYDEKFELIAAKWEEVRCTKRIELLAAAGSMFASPLCAYVFV